MKSAEAAAARILEFNVANRILARDLSKKIPMSLKAIVKTLSAYNTATGAATVITVQLTDTSATGTITWDKASVAAVTRKAFLQNGEVLVLDETDVIKLTASVANKFHVYIGILETD